MGYGKGHLDLRLYIRQVTFPLARVGHYVLGRIVASSQFQY